MPMSSAQPPDEKKLIEDLQNPQTSRDAFGRLMREYGPRIYWQIRKMVTSHDDANDLLQNSFMKVWNNLHNFRGDARLLTWLYKIAINETINFINKERLRREITDGSDDSFLLSNIEADPYYDGDSLQTELLKAVASLPEKQRLVFNMRYFDDMKYEDISEILGTSVGALKASYHHAVKKVSDRISAIEA